METNREKKEILTTPEEFIHLEKSLLKEHIILLLEHFLFNAINSLKGAAILGQRALPEMLDDFSTCLRYQFQCLRCADNQPLSEECEFLLHYIRLEQMRYKDLSVKWDIEETDVFVPPMCISLLLSKSISQCMSTARQEVHIYGRNREDAYVLRIWNTAETGETTEENTIEQTRRMVAHWWEMQSGANLSWSRQENGVLLTAHIPLVH